MIMRRGRNGPHCTEGKYREYMGNIVGDNNEEHCISVLQTTSGRRRRRRRNVPPLAKIRRARQVLEVDQSEGNTQEPERMNITLVSAWRLLHICVIFTPMMNCFPFTVGH